MSANRVFRSPRRPGISNLIGAIFFVLIVALSIADADPDVHGVERLHRGDTHDQRAAAAGGELQRDRQRRRIRRTARQRVAMTGGSPGIPLNPSAPIPLLPISNMNFSGGMQGWYVSESYPTLVDGATVSNALVSNGSSYIELTKVPDNQPRVLRAQRDQQRHAREWGLYRQDSAPVDTYFTTVSGGTCTSGCVVGTYPQSPQMQEDTSTTSRSQRRLLRGWLLVLPRHGPGPLTCRSRLGPFITRW